MAMDQKTPAHERLRFLGIAAASLDEFFECQVASLKWKEAITQESGITHGTTRGRCSPQEQLKKVSR
jgi:polyphosphate kinase